MGLGLAMAQLCHGQAKIQDQLDSFGVNTLKDRTRSEM